MDICANGVSPVSVHCVLPTAQHFVLMRVVPVVLMDTIERATAIVKGVLI